MVRPLKYSLMLCRMVLNDVSKRSYADVVVGKTDQASLRGHYISLNMAGRFVIQLSNRYRMKMAIFAKRYACMKCMMVLMINTHIHM